jgi:5'-methylthioadenosine phosphorylase
VGGIRSNLLPGTLVVPDQILDYTFGRNFTYFDGKDRPVTNIDFTRPYNEKLRQQILAAVKSADELCMDGGVHAVTQGPRLETAAEINRLERDGADMVGMTGMPEAALAKELGLAYATIAVVVNSAAGRGNSIDRVPLETIGVVMSPAMERVRIILERAVEQDGD